MANTYKKITIHQVTGILDDPSVSKTRSGETIIISKTMFDDKRESSETQQDALREAATYANFASAQEVYINKARRTETTAYNIAIADWFVAPKVLEIDVDNWTGEIGQTVRVKARDNVMVARVSVVICDAGENVLESGEDVQAAPGSAWWNYTTQSVVKMNPFPLVEAIAQDLPGNIDSFVIS